VAWPSTRMQSVKCLGYPFPLTADSGFTNRPPLTYPRESLSPPGARITLFAEQFGRTAVNTLGNPVIPKA
jgi:hypothetical protein